MYIVQIIYFAEKFLVHFSPPEPAAHEYSSVWGGVCGWVRDGGGELGDQVDYSSLLKGGRGGRGGEGVE